MSSRDIAHSLFEEAIALQRPSNIVFLSCEKYEDYFVSAERIFPVAVGKASVMMMDGFLKYIEQKHKTKIFERPIVVSNPQENSSTFDFNHIISSHPTPDANSVNASKEVLKYVAQSNNNDLVVFLLSGGGSSLLSLPAEGISLEDKIQLTNLLLSAGCNINEINTIRKHISGIKGGRLNSAALPSKTLSLVISDVINDDLSSIASGPTVADKTTFSDAIDILSNYNIYSKVPQSIQNHLKKGLTDNSYETPKHFTNNISEIISSNQVFRKTLVNIAETKNYKVINLENTFEKLAIDDAQKLYHEANKNKDKSIIIISGGETLVNLTGTGKGGRNQEFALSFLNKYLIEGSDINLCLYSVGTDGIDGPTDAAGAIVDNHTISRYKDTDLDIESYLTNNDSYSFFSKLDSLIKIGPTGTNVADIQITIIN